MECQYLYSYTVQTMNATDCQLISNELTNADNLMPIIKEHIKTKNVHVACKSFHDITILFTIYLVYICRCFLHLFLLNCTSHFPFTGRKNCGDFEGRSLVITKYIYTYNVFQRYNHRYLQTDSLLVGMDFTITCKCGNQNTVLINNMIHYTGYVGRSVSFQH